MGLVCRFIMRATIIFLVVAAALAVAAASTLQSIVTIDAAEHKFGEELPVTVTIFNPSPVPVTILTWRTPLEGIRHPVFTVFNTHTDNHAPYKGMLAKRAEPDASAFRTLQPGEVVRSTFDLTQYYHFMEQGMHEVSLEVALEVMLDGQVTSEVLSSPPALVYVSHVRPDLLYSEPEVAPDAIGYVGCSSSQQSTILSALSIAKTDAQQAYMYLLTASCTGDYTTFFGTVTSTRFNTVFSHFDSIVSALNSNNFKFDCSTCNMPGTYAYVYPFDPTKTIYLCSVFWTAPAGSHQYNSRPGTITHEMSHFNAVAGTDDIQYGVVGCKSLANNNPSQAIKNADSHEFFQEMNPKC